MTPDNDDAYNSRSPIEPESKWPDRIAWALMVFTVVYIGWQVLRAGAFWR